jgi:glutaredoxin-like protein
MSENDSIVLYGTTWCGGSRRCRLLLDRQGIPYKWVDIDQDEKAGKYLESLNGGHRSVPTLVWPDGSKLTEPTEAELAIKLGVRL